jgi:hypothetical protein
MGLGNIISTDLREAPFASPLHHRAAEPPGAERRDDEAAPDERSVRLGVAGAAEGDQPVAIEVRAALGAFLDVMDLEAVRGEPACLAPPTGAGKNLGPDFLPGLEAR